MVAYYEMMLQVSFSYVRNDTSLVLPRRITKHTLTISFRDQLVGRIRT